ncbi:MAG: chorismate synthase [Candidatus Cloacimonadaceae bacterium]
MRSNKLASLFGITTFGESHGTALGLVIEDIRPNLDFPFDELNRLLSERKPVSTIYSTSRQETDDYEILSGVLEGKTTGMPICIIFRNKDARSVDYEQLKDVFRPGHADYAWFNKFKIYDYRGGGRASGRETICRVAASALVSEFIKPVTISFQTVQIGEFCASDISKYCHPTAANPFCWSDKRTLSDLYAYLDEIKAEKDTVGGIVNIRIDGVPIGLGDPVFEKLNANLAKAIMSVGSVRGVSFGDGFEICSQKGSEVNDQMSETGFLSNRQGGISGGISTGQPIIINVAVKPISSHGKPQQTIDKAGNPVTIRVSGRHDVCHIPRLIPVLEAMLKLTLADAISWQKQLSGVEINLTDYREMIDKIDSDLLLLLYIRKAVVQQVRELKAKQGIAFRDAQREQELAERFSEIARELDLSEDKAKAMLITILELCRDDNSVPSL